MFCLERHNLINGFLGKIRANKVAVGILLVSLGLNFYGINWGLPYPAPPVWDVTETSGEDTTTVGTTLDIETALQQETDRDEEDGKWRPWQYGVSPITPLAAAKERFSWGRWSSRVFTYPLAHYMILAMSYTPYVAYLFLSGGFVASPAPGYPYGLSDPILSLTVFELITRGVSAVMGTGIVLSSFLIVKEMFDHRAAIFSAIIVAFSYPLIFYAHVANLDIPYIFWFFWALYAFVLAIKRQQAKYYLFFGALAALSFATKDQVYALLFILAVPLVWLHYRHHHPEEKFSLIQFVKTLWHRELIYGLVGFVVTFAISNNLIFNMPRAVLHYTKITTINRAFDRYLDPSVPFDHYLLFRQTLYFLFHSYGAPVFVICLIGLVYALYVSPKNSFLLFLPAIVYYALFIVMSAFYVHPRHVIPIAIILAFFGGKFLADVTRSKKLPGGAVYAALSLIFVYSFLYALGVGLSFVKDTRRMAGTWIADNIESGATIEVYTSRFVPYSLYNSPYQVSLLTFGGQTYAQDLNIRQPDYIILTENVYRANSDQRERENFSEALATNNNLRMLVAGELGYKLQADYESTLSWAPWQNDPDMFLMHNPRIMVFERRTGSVLSNSALD